MAATEETTTYVGSAVPRQARTRGSSPATAPTSTTTRPGSAPCSPSSAAPSPTHGSRSIDVSKARSAARRRRRVHRRGSQGSVAERAAVHLAGVGRHQDAAAPAALRRQGALRRRRRRGRRRREPCAGERTRPTLVEVDYEPLPGGTDVEKALDDGAPLVHDDVARQQLLHVVARRAASPTASSPRRPVVVKERYRQQRLIPTAMEPRGVVCEISPLDRRGDRRHLHAGAAHHAHGVHARDRASRRPRSG